ncbi:MAG: hypothetical protein VB070_10375 [Clostridiaceae bacterium]|nr:hypothetical protein [Clostridiaceae bacterium]
MKEPVWGFIEELQKPLHIGKPAYWHMRAAQDQELSLAGGIRVNFAFPDPAGVLETALTDFGRFCQIMDLEGKQQDESAVQLLIREADTECFEAFRLRVGTLSLILEAADTEGLRRGLVFLEEQITAAGAPVLPLGLSEQKPFIRTRLSRCFFGPIKRPPMNRDELEDDINYYPDEYLNRLAHEGVNALWLTITFRDTVPSRILPGFGRRAAVHIPKLQQTVARCARYGIRIFAFFIEPTAFIDERNNNRYLDLKQYEKDFPELIGHRQDNLAGFCPSSDLARSFLYEAAHTLFELVPGLGGMIDISVGERFTHCRSLQSDRNNCPRCSKREPRDVLADVLSCLQNGMHDANPQAEFISWPYSQYLLWGDAGTAEAAGHVPSGVILQHNYESSGITEQLGRLRRADDYWLSYTGPSDLYRRCAVNARANGTRMFAKLQVGCSHEVASATHVPVPGILYDKYRRMKELGVSGAMQSWYFGNYPSMMTRAAGRLSFEPFPMDKMGFLSALARPCWGPYTETVVRAWEYFQEAYAQYPVYHVFGYYAPMHDGPVWPLYLQPVNKPLIPNWKFMPEFPEYGDRIGECLQDAFTLEEALLLCSRLQRTWQEGVHLLDALEPVFSDDTDRRRDINTARALGILFTSGYDILRFYQLREFLADATGEEALGCLTQMKELVNREIGCSRQLIQYCLIDPALGFNSEHEGYRFYPDKLENRIQQLQGLLQTDFPALEMSIREGRMPFPQYTGKDPDRAVYTCPLAVRADHGTGAFGVNWQAVGLSGTLEQGAARFKACYDENWLYLAVTFNGKARPLTIRLFPQRLWPDRTYVFDPATASTKLIVRDPVRPPLWPESLDTEMTSGSQEPASAGAAAESGNAATTVAVRIAFDELQRPEHCRLNPLRVNLILTGEHAEDQVDFDSYAWVRRPAIAQRLAQSPVNPDEYGWFSFA